MKNFNNAVKLRRSSESDNARNDASDYSEAVKNLFLDVWETKVELENGLRELEKEEEELKNLERRRASLSSAEVCEKIKRYDTAAWNKLERARELLLLIEKRHQERAN